MALDILRAELRQAEADREFHRVAGRRGNVEMSIAAFKATWLEKLIAQIERAERQTEVMCGPGATLALTSPVMSLSRMSLRSKRGPRNSLRDCGQLIGPSGLYPTLPTLLLLAVSAFHPPHVPS